MKSNTVSSRYKLSVSPSPQEEQIYLTLNLCFTPTGKNNQKLQSTPNLEMRTRQVVPTRYAC